MIRDVGILSVATVVFTDPHGREIMPRVYEQGSGNFTVEYTPSVIGQYDRLIASVCTYKC